MTVTRVMRTAGWTTLLLALLLPVGTQAQIAWDAPLLVAPNAPAGFSFFVAEMEPRDGIAGMIAWRQQSAPGSIGFRAGIGEGGGDKVAGFGAFDYSGLIHGRNEEFPLDVAWVTGAGIGFGDWIILSAPLGASFAYPISAEDIWFNPYVTPMVVLDWYLGAPSPADGNGDDFDLGVAVDIGADLAFASSWAIRFGATVGDRRGIAIGLHFPGVQLGG